MVEGISKRKLDVCYLLSKRKINMNGKDAQ